MTENDIIHIWTDGGCRGNNPSKEYNIGAWSFIIEFPDGKIVEESQYQFNTTNNQMELSGCLKALQTIQDKSDKNILITSDSKYLIDGVTSWSKNWIKNGWKTADKKPVKNEYYWKEILATIKQFSEVKFRWVRGHSDCAENNRCDELLNQAMNKVLMKG